jgi:peptide/nickel transport system permease protein
MRYGVLVRRLLTAIITVILAIFISFVLVRVNPSGPINAILSQGGGGLNFATSKQYELEIQYYYGLYPKGPLPLQFFNYMWSFLHGNFGRSIQTNLPVSLLIAQTLPWTLFIVISGTLISFFLGTSLGMRLGYRRSGTGAVVGLQIWHSVPSYVVALVILVVFAFYVPVFPKGGNYSPGVRPGLNLPFVESVLYHAVLPLLAFVLVSFTGWTLAMRANVQSILGEDYITEAEARGLPQGRIVSRYVGRNAILPQFTVLIIALGGAFSGQVFIEQIFSYPGVGYLLVQAINFNDYPIIMAIFIMIITATVFGLLIADFVYTLLDPRVRTQ